MAPVSVFRYAFPGGDRLHAAVGGPRQSGCGRDISVAQKVDAFPPAGILCHPCREAFGHRAHHAVDQGILLPPLPTAQVPAAEMPVSIFVVNGVEGPSVYFNNYRLAGNKPWGGGSDVVEWATTWGDLVAALGGPDAIKADAARNRIVLSVGPAAMSIGDRTVAAGLVFTNGYTAHAWATTAHDMLVSLGLPR